MRTMICAAILSALAAGPAISSENSKATSGSAEAGRTVYICDNSAMTRRAFAREFGKTEFVKADAAAAKGERWTAPKCMTAREARRLKQLARLD
ncbi:hypothetical protein [Phenylobacterium sp. CCH9-H3]|uniref:hypothetical protein n=1 Tax=Phenylobacterium sp. CCH9-H3 TaxID=1768774 RepID=UPI000839E6D5|nr:hypothetical protein [Phenylobacterium sp. CCH9-H3]